MSYKRRINESTTTTELQSLSPKHRHTRDRTNQSSTTQGYQLQIGVSDKSDSDDDDYDNIDYDEEEDEDDFDIEDIHSRNGVNGLSYSQQQTQNVSLNTPKSPQIMSGDPSKWDWDKVEIWLETRDLSPMIEIFAPKKDIFDGNMLLTIDRDILWINYKDNLKQKLNINSRKQITKNQIIARFLRELPGLKLRAINYKNKFEDNKYYKETTIYDVLEMERRIKEFTDKWDKILWIEYYFETNNCKPNKERISSELEVSTKKSAIYLEYYDNKDKFIEKDLKELLIDFNVYNDCIIWWYIIINKLKTYPTKAVWLIFAEIAKMTPHKVALELLQIYQEDLTRFEADQLHKVTQNIVIGSEYPICTALRIAKWFVDRAEFDIARGIFCIFPFISLHIKHVKLLQGKYSKITVKHISRQQWII